MSDLDYYLNHDHAARRNTTLVSVTAGAGTGMLLEWAGAPSKIPAICSVLIIGAIEVVRAWRYVQPAERTQFAADAPSATRRSLILAPVSALVFMIVALLPVPRIEAAVVERRLRDDADAPFKPENAQDIIQTLNHAQDAKIKVPSHVIERVGKKFLDAANSDPTDKQAWNAAMACLDYRCFLNTDFQPPLPALAHISKKDLGTYYVRRTLPGTEIPDMYPYGAVPVDQAARFNLIGVNWQMGREFGNEFLVIQGKPGRDETVVLDKMDMKNVIVKDTKVFYNGMTALMLENVCLVNCSVFLTQGDNGTALAHKLLESPCVTVTLSGELPVPSEVPPFTVP